MIKTNDGFCSKSMPKPNNLLQQKGIAFVFWSSAPHELKGSALAKSTTF